jgi:hypothetical protein
MSIRCFVAAVLLLTLPAFSQTTTPKKKRAATTARKPAAKPVAPSGNASWPAPTDTPGPLQEGTVTGSFIVNGKKAVLTHVYALVKPDTFHEEKDAVYVVISDQPLEEKALRDEMGLFEPAREHKIHIIEVRFDEKMQPTGGQLYHDGFKDNASVSVSGMHEFLPSPFDGKSLAGKLYVEKQTMFDDTETWEYTATFSAPINPKPKPQPEKLAALDSPPAKAVEAFLKAARAKDKAALKKTIAPEMAADLDGPNGAAMLEMLPTIFDANMKITKVAMKGTDRAEVTLEHREKGSSEKTQVGAAIVDGVWKVSK